MGLLSPADRPHPYRIFTQRRVTGNHPAANHVAGRVHLARSGTTVAVLDVSSDFFCE